MRARGVLIASTAPAEHDLQRFLAMDDRFKLVEFLGRIDQNPELRGMRVVYFDGLRIHIVRDGPQMCASGLKSIVIHANAATGAMHHAETAAARDSRLYVELLSGALGCGSAAIGWVVFAGSLTAVPITGGASSFITVLSATAAGASTAQCLNSGVRVYNELESPGTNDWLDAQWWYTGLAKVLDVISLVGAASSASASLKMALTLRRTTGKTMVEVLKGLSRQERARIAEEVIRIENPGISNSALKTLMRAGVYPKRFTGLQVSHAVRTQLKDALGAALTFSGSALSGVVREYGVGLMHSFETY